MRHASDTQHLEAAYTANAADLLNYFGRRVDNRADAADLLGETFLIATRRANRMPRDTDQARMWLFGVARNVLSNSRRSLRRQSALSAKLRETIETAPGGTVTTDVQLDIQRALHTLPSNQAELVRLVLWDGFTVIQAAAILEISESTARGRYQRAMSHLRSTLSATPTPTHSGGVDAPGEQRLHPRNLAR